MKEKKNKKDETIGDRLRTGEYKYLGGGLIKKKEKKGEDDA